MALLVTGAMGHVGLAVTRLAARHGLDVVAQYNRTFDADAAREVPAARWVSCDLADPAERSALLSDPAIDGAIHTAAIPNDRLAGPAPASAFELNTAAVAALAEAARVKGWRRFIQVSTGSVFQGETRFDRPLLEDHPPAATSAYGATKLAAEILTTMYRRQFGVPAATVRISFVYGPPLVPRERDLPRGPVVSLLREAVLGIAVREASGGDFAASFTHVEDVAEGLLAAYLAPELKHDIYHLGHGRNWTTFEVARAIADAVPGATVEVGPGTQPWTTFNTMRGALGGSRLKEDTGFVPRLPLADGIAAFAAWMQAHPERLNLR